jgi:hypothetical protein
MFGEWYQKTNKTEDTAVTRSWIAADRFLKRPLLTVSRSFMNVVNSMLRWMMIIFKANKVILFVSSV